MEAQEALDLTALLVAAAALERLVPMEELLHRLQQRDPTAALV